MAKICHWFASDNKNHKTKFEEMQTSKVFFYIHIPKIKILFGALHTTPKHSVN